MNDNWIPCIKQSPKIDEIVLIYLPDAEPQYRVWLGYLEPKSKRWANVDGELIDELTVSHWQPRPGPPRGFSL